VPHGSLEARNALCGNTWVDSELGGYDNFVTAPSDEPSQLTLGSSKAVHSRDIEVPNSRVERRPEKPLALASRRHAK
jgi:hypothetical protein